MIEIRRLRRHGQEGDHVAFFPDYTMTETHHGKIAAGGGQSLKKDGIRPVTQSAVWHCGMHHTPLFAAYLIATKLGLSVASYLGQDEAVAGGSKGLSRRPACSTAERATHTMTIGIDAAYGLLAVSYTVGAIGYTLLYVAHVSG